MQVNVNRFKKAVRYAAKRACSGDLGLGALSGLGEDVISVRFEARRNKI
jgi:hypothetical protein